MAGTAILVPSSGESHCAVTDANIAPGELQAKQEIIMRGITLFGSPIPSHKGCRGEVRLNHVEPLNSSGGNGGGVLKMWSGVREPSSSHSDPACALV